MMRIITKTLLASIVTAVFLVGCSGFRDSVVGTYQAGPRDGVTFFCTFDRNGTVTGKSVYHDFNETKTGPEHKWKVVGKEIWILDVDVAFVGKKIRDVVFAKKENGDLIMLSLDGESGKGKGRESALDDLFLKKLK